MNDKGSQHNNTQNNNNTSHNSSKRKGKNSKGAQWKSNRLPSANKENFKGECEELNGKIFYIGSPKQADNYNTTHEAIMDYFLRKYTHGLDLVQTLEAMKMKDFGSEMPVKTIPSGATDEQKEAIADAYKEEMKYYVKRKKLLDTNIVMAYGVIWGQCTKALRAKLETRKNWNEGNAKDQIKYNAINLLRAIKEITHNYQDNKYAMESIYYSLCNMFVMRQEEN